jgi:AcrR family transcriptional regulator
LAQAGSRQSQKAATRERVLDAARELFSSVGYQAATVRQIAQLAGVSVGSVFTTFASKGEILSQVMAERLEALYAELDQAIPKLQGSTADRLRSLFAVGIRFECANVQLFLAHVAAAFDWTLSPNARPFGRTPRLRGLIKDCLAHGVAVGEIDASADLEALLDLLLGAYAWTFRLAAWDNADVEALTRVMDQQVGLIAQGFRRR